MGRIAERLGFLHIPKTGGTAIEAWGLDHGVEWGKHDGSLKGNKHDTGCNAWHTPQRLERESFCVVRKPFDRLMSEYKHRACARHALKDPCNLSAFNDWVRQIMTGSPTANDCHLVPQTRYLDFCDNILRYDSLQAEFSELISRRTTDFQQNDPRLLLDVVPQPRVKITDDCDLGCDFGFHDLDSENQQAFNLLYAPDILFWENQTISSSRHHHHL